MISNLIVRQINFSLSRMMRATAINNIDIDVTFRMTIPAWVKDSDMIKDDKTSIMYMANKKSGIDRFVVTLDNINYNYPRVSNNKCLCIKHRYSIIDWIKSNKDYSSILFEDREIIFREIKSNIILENIGELTKKWNAATEGKFYEDTRRVYGHDIYVRGNALGPKVIKVQEVEPIEFKIKL